MLLPRRVIFNSTRQVSHVFGQSTAVWWDLSGPFGPLQRMNQLRVPLIRDELTNARSPPYAPLEGVSILDIGCGGGLLSEPLSRLGAKVLGIDASKEAVAAACEHASADLHAGDLKLTYRNTTTQQLIEEKSEQFDCVVCSEVIEHVDNPEQLVNDIANLLTENGVAVFTTINQTFISNIVAIYLAENVLSLVPKGAHDWNKFMRPEYLQRLLMDLGYTTTLLHGMTYNLLTKKWSWIKNTSINYSLVARKMPY